MDNRDKIKDIFSWHEVGEEGNEKIRKLRAAYLNFGFLIDEVVPYGREHSLAITQLERSMHHAVAGIAQEPPKRSPGV